MRYPSQVHHSPLVPLRGGPIHILWLLGLLIWGAASLAGGGMGKREDASKTAQAQLPSTGPMEQT